jgi:hypothetical protein
MSQSSPCFQRSLETNANINSPALVLRRGAKCDLSFDYTLKGI